MTKQQQYIIIYTAAYRIVLFHFIFISILSESSQKSHFKLQNLN